MAQACTSVPGGSWVLAQLQSKTLPEKDNRKKKEKGFSYNLSTYTPSASLKSERCCGEGLPKEREQVTPRRPGTTVLWQHSPDPHKNNHFPQSHLCKQALPGFRGSKSQIESHFISYFTQVTEVSKRKREDISLILSLIPSRFNEQKSIKKGKNIFNTISKQTGSKQ